jgi:tetratricopeptide (TPR) repeat protein
VSGGGTSAPRRAVLHIGVEKTGTTTLQQTLAAGRPALAAAGVHYPRSPAADPGGLGGNHLLLAIHAAEPEATRDLRRVLGRDAEARIAGFPAALAAEVAALPPAVHTVLFSNEHCHSRVTTAAGVARLQALLAPLFDRVEVLVWLRRQDQLAASRYTEGLRHGARRLAVLPEADPADAYYDFAALLDRWAGGFGRAAIRPRIFDRAAFPDGDIVAEVLAVAGIGPVGGLARVPDRNTALSPEAQALLRALNLAAEARSGLRSLRPPLLAYVSRIAGGAGRRPGQAEAAGFLGAHAEGNERVRAGWFPERARLFPGGPEEWPEQPDPEPALDGVAPLLFGAMLDLDGARRRERALALVLDGRLHMAEGRTVLAAERFAAALAERPGFVPALRAEAELALAEGRAEAARALLDEALRAEPANAEVAALRTRAGAEAARGPS